MGERQEWDDMGKLKSHGTERGINMQGGRHVTESGERERQEEKRELHSLCQGNLASNSTCIKV